VRVGVAVRGRVRGRVWGQTSHTWTLPSSEPAARRVRVRVRVRVRGRVRVRVRVRVRAAELGACGEARCAGAVVGGAPIAALVAAPRRHGDGREALALGACTGLGTVDVS